MFSLKQLKYALAVARTLHFKKAAEECHVSQSAMSTAINELEKQIGFNLFERNNKQVLVTSQGEAFLKKAEIIILEMDELQQMSRLSASPLSTPMKLGVIPTIGPYLLPKVLPAVRQEFPEFKLHIIEEQSAVLVDMVRRGDLDAAILALPYPINGLISFKFWQEDFYWISHKDECPSGVKEITTNELELEKLMLLKDGHCLKDHALAACQRKPKEGEQEFAATSLHTLIQMVAGKIGTTLVPEMALEQLISTNAEIKAVHLNEPGPHRDIALVIRPNYVRLNELEILKNMFCKVLSKNTDK
jgi:LysR family hydrogen peroxide-inducible transcriptional activator